MQSERAVFFCLSTGEDMEELTEGKLKRLRNLKLYKDKTDEEILAMLAERKASTIPVTKQEKVYQQRFDEKLKVLQEEFGLDMNTANDVEMVNNLIRQMLQAENTDKDILNIQEKQNKNKDDVATLKALGDFQRDVQITIADLQDKLGITRKVRKEKAMDDVPKFIDDLLFKAKNFWERKTVAVECPKCNIELLRYWLNFPAKTTKNSFISECPHCGDKVVYNT